MIYERVNRWGPIQCIIRKPGVNSPLTVFVSPLSGGNTVWFVWRDYLFCHQSGCRLRRKVKHHPPQNSSDRRRPPPHIFSFLTKKRFPVGASVQGFLRFCCAVWLYGKEDSARADPCWPPGVPTLETSSLQCWHLVGAQGQGLNLPLIRTDAIYMPKPGGFGFWFLC